MRIDKKVVELEGVRLNMIIWDIGGEQTQSRIPVSYYLGSCGVIYVFDISRPSSFLQLKEDITFIKEKLPDVPIIIVGNKIDLLDETSLAEVKSIIPMPVDYYSSAKTGENVEETFIKLAQDIINDH